MWRMLSLFMGLTLAAGFSPTLSSNRPKNCYRLKISNNDINVDDDRHASAPLVPSPSRRSLFQTVTITTASLVSTAFLLPTSSALAKSEETAAAAAASNDLDSCLYRIVRVREATQQERRLISTGKFKDVQRANVKLAVKFMVQNYRLADSVVGASAFLSGGNAQQMKAIDVGQTAVQNLQTILEYFDTQDVENIKVGGSSMSGKEDLVVKGLQAAQTKIDEFLAFFPAETVGKVKARVQEENELNVKEFDKSLGEIINLPPPS